MDRWIDVGRHNIILLTLVAHDRHFIFGPQVLLGCVMTFEAPAHAQRLTLIDLDHLVDAAMTTRIPPRC